MKNNIVFSLILLMLILFSSCRKDPSLDPSNPEYRILKISVDVNLRPEAKYYLVLENNESNPIFYKLSSRFGYIQSRGSLFVGNTINLHFILIDELADNTIDIKSFFDVPLGRDINISDGNLKSTQADNAIVNLSFVNIPDFDIVSRTAKNAEQGFTQNKFETPATTAEFGGETYEDFELFYACFQKGNTASYKLTRVPRGLDDYTIDFSDLESDVVKYTFSKTLNGTTISHADVQAWGNAIFYMGYVEIFNLDNFDIYPTSTFDIFIPRNEFDLIYYVQNFTFENSTYIYNNWSFSQDFKNSFDMFDGSLSTSSQIGELPIIESDEEAYDIAEIVFESENFHWSLFGPNTNSFYIPDIPAELTLLLPEKKDLHEQFLSQEGGRVKLIDYSAYIGYEEVLNLHLGDTIVKIESNYKTQEQRFSIK